MDYSNLDLGERLNGMTAKVPLVSANVAVLENLTPEHTDTQIITALRALKGRGMVRIIVDLSKSGDIFTVYNVLAPSLEGFALALRLSLRYVGAELPSGPMPADESYAGKLRPKFHESLEAAVLNACDATSD